MWACCLCGVVAFVGLSDGVSGSFASPQKTCRGAPAPLHPRPGAAAPGPRKTCRSFPPAFCSLSSDPSRPPWPSSPAGRAPGGRCGPFLFFAKSPPLLLPRPPRSLKQGRNGPQSRSFAPLPGRNIARRPPLGLAPLVLEAAFRPAPASLLPLASRGGRRDASRPPSPGLRPGLPVWRRGPRPRQPNAAPPAQRPCSPLPPGFRAYYRSFVCILAHVPYRCPYRAN